MESSQDQNIVMSSRFRQHNKAVHCYVANDVRQLARPYEVQKRQSPQLVSKIIVFG